MMRRVALAFIALVLAWSPAPAASPGQKAVLFGAPGWVLPGASVDLDFANNRYFLKGATGPLTVSRASVGMAQDKSGNWVSFPANTLRRTNQGALLEEARTNTNLNSSLANSGGNPTGWAVYNNTNITPTLNGYSTVKGLNTASYTFSGTPTSTNSTQICTWGSSTAATYGQAWTQSTFLSSSNNTNVTFTSFYQTQNSSFATVNYVSLGITPTPTLARYYNSSTISTSAEVYVYSGMCYQFSFTSGQAVNFTVQIAAPQLELNPLIPATVVSAVVAANGTGGTNGTAVYSVAGGTCTTQPTLNVTWAAGVLTVNSVANAGSCLVLPPSPATLAYVSGTASGWTGATVTLTPTNNASQGFPTSVILTSGSAAARAADNESIGVAPGAASLWASGTPISTTGSLNNQNVVSLYNSGATNQITLGRYGSGAPGAAFFGNASSGNYVQGYGATWAQNVFGKLSQFTVGTTAYAAFNNSSFSVAQANGRPGPMTTLNMGSSYNSFNYWNGYISRVAVSAQSLLNN